MTHRRRIVIGSAAWLIAASARAATKHAKGTKGAGAKKVALVDDAAPDVVTYGLRERLLHPLDIELASLGNAFRKADDVLAQSVGDDVGRPVVDERDLLRVGALGALGCSAGTGRDQPGNAADHDLATVGHLGKCSSRQSALLASTRIIKSSAAATGAPVA